jgi:hypothetical protein
LRSIRLKTAILALMGLCFPERSVSEPAIADNSFLIEEAYNQEKGVVQHILTITRETEDGDDIFTTFTQEWPFFSQTHQLSYTVTHFLLQGEEDDKDFGDLFLNYRYQLGKGAWAAAPRATVIVPLGDSNSGEAADEVGFQGNLPVSIQLTPSLVTHLNAGVEVLDDLTSPFFGASLIAPVDRNFNFMVEAVFNFPEEEGLDGETEHPRETTLSPGIRGAGNVKGGVEKGGVQIVPGIAVPITWRDGDTTTQLFLYISVEHTFSRN